MKQFKAVHTLGETKPEDMLMHLQIINESLKVADNLASIHPVASSKYVSIAALYSGEVLKYFMKFEEMGVDNEG